MTMEAIRLYVGVALIILGIAGAVLLLLQHISKTKRDIHEPPYIEPKIPFIGHILGLIRKKTDYYVEQSNISKQRIYTLLMPGMAGNRVYIINSPDLVVAVQRLPSTLSFWPVMAAFTCQLAGLSPYAAKSFADNAHGEDGKPSMMRAEMENAHAAFKSGGRSLAAATEAALGILAPAVGRRGERRAERMELGRWVADVVMEAVTGSIFGPQNPFADKDLGNAFEELESNALGLMSFPYLSITCRKAYAGRERLVAGFKKYYDDNGEEGASQYIRGQSQISSTYNFSNEDKARFDTANAHAILANTTPTAFWTLYHIISNPSTLQEVRDAVLPLVSVAKTDDGTEKYELDASALSGIPILHSIFHEALRHYGNGAGTRIVISDTLLDNQYLLKKDSFVFMPNRSFHSSADSWGPTVHEFDAHRFMKSKVHSGAFRGFGGGANLCPGRFFAMNVTLAMCVVVVMRFDFKPVGGRWVHPGTDQSNITLLVHPPKAKVVLDVEPREGWNDRPWAFRFQ